MHLKSLLICFFRVFLMNVVNSTALDDDNSAPISDQQNLPRIDVVSLTEPDAEGNRILQLNLEDSQHILHLQRKSVFAPDFRILSPYFTSDGSTVFEELLDEEHANFEDLGDFYSVEDSPGSFFIRKESDNVVVDGIINDFLRVLPTNGDHRAIYVNPNTELLQQDSVIVNYTETDPKESNLQLKYYATSTNIPDPIYLEILVVMDYVNSKALGFSNDKIKKYLGIFWNSVQRRFDDAKNPTIKIVISNAIMMKHPSFVNAYKVRTIADSNHLLDTFSRWVYSKKNHLKKFDVAVLMTGLDLQNFKTRGDILGVAYVGATCLINDDRREASNIALVEDIIPIYSGVLTAAHEVAHLLSSNHDGESTSKSCAISDGYIMAPSRRLSENHWKFSSCSLKAFSHYVRTSAKCLRDKPQERIPLVNILPGILLTLDQQCSSKYGFESKAKLTETPEVCFKLWCSINNQGALRSHGGAAEGSPCGSGRRCVKGQCVKTK